MAAFIVPAPIAALPWRMLLILFALAGAGALTLYSAAGGSLMPWSLPHLVRFGVALGLAIVVSYVRPETLKRFIFPAYGIILALLVLVLAIGVVGGGARSWLPLGFMQLQPSELMKPALVVALARFYEIVPPRQTRTWTALWPAGLLFAVPAGLILLQPDLGTTMLLAFSAVTVMFLAGLPLRLFVGAGLALAAAVPLGYNFLMPHQQKRLLIFLNPEEDPLGAGYHLTQSKIAIGSGGLFGKGYLQGSQSHLQYLPEQHTDFIFSAFVEEWGFAGGLVVIALFLLLFRWGMGVALDAKTRFERLTAAGLTATLFYYTAVNLMMVMGLAPVVGIPLPLLSHGGSAMLTVMLSIGILMSIDRATRFDPRRREM